MTDNSPVERGIGCASVVPAGLIGFAALTDGAGPRGWLGFAELIGWAAVCVAAALAVTALLGQWRKSRVRLYPSMVIAVGLVAVFTYAQYWLGLDAPMSAKVIFTTSLQIVGSLVAGGLVLWVGWIIWSGQRRF